MLRGRRSVHAYPGSGREMWMCMSERRAPEYEHLLQNISLDIKGKRGQTSLGPTLEMEEQISRLLLFSGQTWLSDICDVKMINRIGELQIPKVTL